MGRMIAGQIALGEKVDEIRDDVKEMRKEKADDDVAFEHRFTTIEAKTERSGKMWGLAGGIFASVASGVVLYRLIG